MASWDIIIVGGGAIGLMTARRITERAPALRVALFDGATPGGASAASGAMIAPYSEITASLRRRTYHESRLSLAVEALGRWKRLLSEDSSTFPGVITGRGTLLLRNTVSGSLEDRNYDAIIDCLRERSIPFQKVAPSDVEGLRPAPHERAVECVLIEDEICIDSAQMLAGLRRWLEARDNVTLHTAGVTRLLHESGRVVGLVDHNGDTHSAGSVLVAGGVQSLKLLPEEAGRARIPPLFAGAGVAILAQQPARPIRRILRTPNRSFSCGLHVLPRVGNMLYIGATNNPSTQMWLLPSLSDVEFLINCATRQVNQELARSAVVALLTGNRPIALDLHPVVGRMALAGLWIATGTYREGLTLSPLLADLLADDILTGRHLPKEFQPIRPPRSEYSRSVAIAEAVDNYLAVGAEHETRLTAAGWADFMGELLQQRVTALYDRLPADFILPPDLVGLVQENEQGVDAAIRGYLAAWA